jgi:putative hydrolase of the HAD superfamily
MHFSTLFFDLDDTLYPKTNGLWGAIRERMTEYMRDRLGFPPEVIPELRRSYFETYGTTLRGLQIHHHVDPLQYLAYVHDLPLEEYIAPDPELRTLLSTLPPSKWIFTNADVHHARRVLAVLNLNGCFDGIIDVRALDFLCKPQPDAYRKALLLAGESDPRVCVLLDDSPRNLAPAKEMGFTTVLVGTDELHPAADLVISSLKDLPHAFPDLWKDGHR